ncbi:hypothetical protein KSS87_018310 [Heliosperma pusillum]|nr:hypothetical protein KSS87_018310 [Heliosperma pusillum]
MDTFAKTFPLLSLILQIHLFSGSVNKSGFALREGESSAVFVPNQWTGHVWGRTLCSTNKSTGNFSCQTGDCTTGNIQCGSLPFVNPVTLVEFGLGLADYDDFYDVSTADGYNLPLSVAPHVDSGPDCDVTGCVFDLQKSCQLAQLMVVSKNNESMIIGCRSPSNFSLASLIFKRPCPRAYINGVDDGTTTFSCDGSRASSYNITFCPSPAMSRILSTPASQPFPPELAPEPDTSSPIPLSPSPLSPTALSPTNNSITKPTHQTLPSNTSKWKVHTGIPIAFLTAAGISIFVLLIIYLCISKRKAINKSNVQTDEIKRLANSLQFDFTTIQLATQNFAAENKLGEGGFGEVYKGKLEGGQEVAVKRLSKNSVQGIAEFETEIVLVARLQHKNLVKLLGYCASPNESLLVYEFLPNSSLDKILFDPAKKLSLDWQTRFNIISGIARGLLGYMAPEYAITGHYSVKSDVYSFGVIVLEIVSGQRNRTFGRLQLDEALLHRAWRLWNEDEPLKLIDTVLEDNFEQEQVLKCIHLGLLCIQENAVDRPRMTFIVASLNGQAIRLPTPKAPHFFGCAVDDDARDTQDGNAALHEYTGDETITDVYSRNAKTLRITNNCSDTVWPVVVSNSATATGSANDSGFALQEGESSVVTVPNQWTGRVWGRTLCSVNKSTGNFSCQTGDCTTGNIQCGSSPYVNPVTLAELSFGQANTEDYYDVSVVDGYNLPLLVAPNVTSAPECAVTGCVFDLQKSCQLAELTVVSKSDDSIVIGCKSPCDVFRTDQFCCNSGPDCQRSNFSLASLIYKRPCPRAYSYVLDDATSTFTCNSLRASSYDITFCPSPSISRLLSIPASEALSPALAPEPDTSSPIPISPTTNSARKPTQQNLPSNTSKAKEHTAMLVAFPTAAGIFIFVLLSIYLCISKRKAMENANVQTDEMKRFANSLQFDFNTIRQATHNFAAENKLGEGGFGEVYKGELEGGQEVAVKRLSKNSVQGIAEFETEIVLVARLQHKNLVKLLGYCASPKESLLVYEYLPNSSLDKFLFDPAKKSSLDWQTRFTIISGISRGLLYLHEDSRIKVVHRDLKPSNILLDEAMNPKIADFGLARLFEVDQTQGDTKRIAGTYGYMAPEYAITGHYSVKSDVFSFGVIVLEIVSGQRNRSFGRLQLEEALLHRAWRLWNEEEPLNLIDTVLEDNFEQEEVLKCIQLGLLCIQENAIDRPRMTSVVASLNGQAIRLPTPKAPHFFGCAVDDEARDIQDVYAAPHVYTGDETITDVGVHRSRTGPDRTGPDKPADRLATYSKTGPVKRGTGPDQTGTLKVRFFPGLDRTAGNAKILTITNSCRYTVWPAIVTTSGPSGTLSTDNSGFALQEGESRAIPVEFNWNGRVWGRTLCSTNKSTRIFSCQTGDCATGNIHCNSSSTSPVTLAEFAFTQYNNYDFYDVSVVRGYNLPLLVAPDVESGPGCAATGCVFDLQNSCLAELKVLGTSLYNNGSKIIGCRSPCELFSTDKYCCNNVDQHCCSNVTDCQRSDFSLSSLIFKKPCPRAYSYARDDAASTFYCDGSMESSYNITFCPSSAMSR